MKHLGTNSLSGNLIYLRRYSIEDSFQMYNNYAKEEAVCKFLSWSPHQNENISKQLLMEWVPNYANEKYYHWAIIINETNELIGGISIVHMDEENETAEVGYCIGSKYWHKGYTSEALKLVINYMFEKINVKKVIAKHDINNVNSGRVMTKCNMKYVYSENKTNKQNQNIVIKVYEIEK